jgi:cytochrome c oxidase subunit 3
MEIPYTLTARPDTGLYNGKLGIWLFLASEVMLFGALFTSYLFMRIGAEDGTWPSHVLSVPLGLTNTLMLILSSMTMVYAWVALKERNLKKYRLYLGATIFLAIIFLCIKSCEYYSKYEHWGLAIKADAMDKYLPQLQKMDAEVTSIPTQQVFQISGDREWAKETNGTVVLTPIKTFHPIGYKPPESAETAEKSDAEEETITVDKADLERPPGRFLPAYGTYFAIYFTVTGLHALHIIGGIIVMLYFLGPGSALYKRNPEQLTNRIEVTGIFWHFVDLVWITVFPILYLT